MRRTDEQCEKRIIQLYNLGEKVDYIAAAVGVGRRTVIDVLRRNRIPHRKRLTMLVYVTRCRELMASGCSAREMATELGVSVSTVYSLIRLSGADGDKPHADS